jgi:two-component system chemotaxis sensor kinase CheA
VDDEATREFVVETQEGLDQLDREFVALEADPRARERIAVVFRTIHTIKGTSAFLGFGRLERLAHAAESLLAMLRDGSLTLSPTIASALLAVVDRVRANVRTIEATGHEASDDHEELIATLAALRTAAPEERAPPPPDERAPPPPPPDERAPRPPPPDERAPPPPPPVAKLAPPAPPEPAPLASPVAALPTPTPPVAAPAAAPASSTAPAPPPAVARELLAELPAAAHATAADSNVRVDVRLLDKLMDIVGELVLARNQIVQVGAVLDDPAFVGAAQRLNLVTAELQEQVMKTRMQPIGSLWAKLPRVVRDLALACGKQVRIEMFGKETELDRTILEAVKDPLTHIVRNAIDHGLETPSVRAAKNKARTGTLVLRAFHEGGQVNIEVSDDGAGLDLEAIRRKAIERGLVTREQTQRLGERELVQLVFQPGFSTARQVTNVSGRGVGMDVVKTNIERIGGTVDLLSQPGAGTTIRIRIPLTLAIVPALIVVQSGQRYAIPQASLVELVHVEAGASQHAIEWIHGVPVYRLRGKLLPIVELGGVLRVGLPQPASSQRDLNIIVLQADDRLFGAVVDEVRDTEEIVVKPLGKELKHIPVFTGATIMGDGRVALILDVFGLAQHAGVARERDDSRAVRTDATEKRPSVGAGGEHKQPLLLFGLPGGATAALPLAEVTRLEEFAAGQLERTGDRCVVQHRGSILPLLDLVDVDRGRTAPLSVIVYTSADRSIGLIVDRIIDIVEDVVRVERCSERGDLIGSAIVQGKVTDLLDLGGVIRQRAPWFFAGATP